jgi:hypothetical protein
VTGDYWLHIAVVAEDGDTFERFIDKMPINWEPRITGSRAIGGGVTYTRISDTTDCAGCRFHGVIYLDEITKQMEDTMRHSLIHLKPEGLE